VELANDPLNHSVDITLNGLAGPTHRLNLILASLQGDIEQAFCFADPGIKS
jgi:hypothetical protein